MLPQIELSRVSLPYASGAGAIDEYAVANLRPELVAAFVDSYYRASSSLTTFGGLITHSAASNATMVDSDGLLKWRPHNIVLNSATPATQSITVISGADYTVECTGVSVALSGAGTGTVTEGNPATITASTTTLTLTVTGSTGTMWAYRSDLGGMVNNPDRGDSYVPTTSSARYLPRRGHHVWNGSAWVNEGLLHESEARTNLWEYSTPVFTNFPVRGGAIANATCAFDVFTAPGIAYTTAGVVSYAYRQFTLTGQYTFSVFVEMDDASAPVFGSSSTTSNSNDFVIVLESSTIDPTTYLIQKMGVSTYRVSGVGTGTGVSGNFGVIKYISNSSRTFKVTGYQLEAGSTPSSYIPTSGNSVNRTPDILTIPSANLPWPTPKVIGPELVTNGTFDTDVSGWTVYNPSFGSISFSSGTLRLTQDVAGSGAIATQAITTVIGATYVISVDFFTDGTTGNNFFYVGTTPGGGQTANVFLGSNTGTYVRTFVATATTHYISVANSSATLAGEYSEWDNISVREINPLAVSIQMDGRMTYADTGDNDEVDFIRWSLDSSNRILHLLQTTGADTGQVIFRQDAAAVIDTAESATTTYSPSTLVPYNIASRHGSTFINGAVDGTALTANTTPVALPDLSSTDLSLAHDYMGTIRQFRVWAADLGDSGIEEASEGEPSSYLIWDASADTYIQKVYD